MSQLETRLQELTSKKEKLDGYRPLPPELVQNLEEWFRVELTYTSNAIEGNTLSRRETALVIEDNISVGGKRLRDIFEAKNLANAWEYAKQFADQTPAAVTQDEILEMHRLFLREIDDYNAGKYRDVRARIRGSDVILPNPAKVPALMTGFLGWLHQPHDDHPVIFAADAHLRSVTIHPFSDGNGRVARLLMSALLLQEDYTPALLTTEDREAYINSIERAQLTDEKEDHYLVIADAVERSLDIYLESAESSLPTPPK